MEDPFNVCEDYPCGDGGKTSPLHVWRIGDRMRMFVEQCFDVSLHHEAFLKKASSGRSRRWSARFKGKFVTGWEERLYYDAGSAVWRRANNLPEMVALLRAAYSDIDAAVAAAGDADVSSSNYVDIDAPVPWWDASSEMLIVLPPLRARAIFFYRTMIELLSFYATETNLPELCDHQSVLEETIFCVRQLEAASRSPPDVGAAELEATGYFYHAMCEGGAFYTHTTSPPSWQEHLDALASGENAFKHRPRGKRAGARTRKVDKGDAPYATDA